MDVSKKNLFLSYKYSNVMCKASYIPFNSTCLTELKDGLHSAAKNISSLMNVETQSLIIVIVMVFILLKAFVILLQS